MSGSINGSITLNRPHIQRAAEGGWYVLLNHGHNGWLVGDRATALGEFAELDRIERTGRA